MDSLNDRRILVTAGPTWVPIDAVRHLGNFSTGRTGLIIARRAAEMGAEVTLLLGPGRVCPTDADRTNLRIIDIVTFDDLYRAVRDMLPEGRFDALIHTAAVSDFQPVDVHPGKLPSGEEELVIRLRPTPKIVDEVRGLDPDIVLVKFKLEVGRTDEELLEIAAQSRRRSDADLIVANDLARMSPQRHPAVILDREGIAARVETTEELADRLLTEVGRLLSGRAVRSGSERVL